jgi:hypothetical protein
MVRGALLRRVVLKLGASALVALAICALAVVTLRPDRTSAATALGPIAAWSFDEGEEAGTTVEDITGDEHEGTIEGATRTNGRYGGALSFDGEDDCVTVPASEDLELPENLTVEAWVKPEGTGEAESIVYKEAEGGWFGYTLLLGLTTTGRMEGFVGDTAESGVAVVSPHTVEPNVWTQVALTYDGRHERLYIDGELVDEELSEPPIENTGPLKIGCAAGGEGHFDGRLDEVRIYERALSGAEIGNGLDRTPPQDIRASGELAELGYPYISGQGTKTVEVSATDDLSGVRSLALEDEGHRLLASYTPTTCVFNSPGADHCPLSVAKELTVNAVRMPEGANHLSAFAEDLAGNISHGSSWVTYVDRIGPSFPSSFEVTVSNELPWADPTVHLPPATDPLLPEGHAGSGVAGQFYRYKLNGGSFTEWSSNEFGAFEVPGAVAGDSISLEAYATDGVGNGGPTRTATVTVPPAEEESEEEGEVITE